MTDDRDKVDDDIINFKTIVAQILSAQFIQTLPFIFNKICHKDEGGDNRPKKKEEQNQEDSRLVKNSGRISEWIAVSGDDYQQENLGNILDYVQSSKAGQCVRDFIQKCIVSQIASTQLHM